MVLPGHLFFEESFGAQKNKAGATFSVFTIPLKSDFEPLQDEVPVFFFLYLSNQTLHSSGHRADSQDSLMS